MNYGWLSGVGPFHFFVISSRVRIARNLTGYFFPYRADEETRKEILQKVKDSAEKEPLLKELEFFDLTQVPPINRQSLVESHLISPYHSQDPSGRGLLKTKDNTISIMINEEDHLRLQCFQPALELVSGWTLLNQVDDALENHLAYAFHEQWGYLSACPTNLGTSLRASTLLHLPALTFLQIMPNLVHSLNQAGIVVRGFYGEGTESQGHYYQISNAFSLGPTEEDIVARVSSVAKQIIEQEVQGRERLRKEQSALLEDRTWRALAILKSSRIINSFETMEHLSLVRLGVEQKILPDIPVKLLNELVLMTRAANLQAELGVEADAMKRDILRANYLRKSLQNY